MNLPAHLIHGQLKMDIFSELNAGGITIVMVTHEPDVARRTSSVLFGFATAGHPTLPQQTLVSGSFLEHRFGTKQ